MKLASRNLWIELAALGLILISLLCFVLAVNGVAAFIVNRLLPNEPPLQSHGLTLGLNETLVAALCFVIPGTALIMAAWSLRSLLVEEDGAEE